MLSKRIKAIANKWVRKNLKEGNSNYSYIRDDIVDEIIVKHIPMPDYTEDFEDWLKEYVMKRISYYKNR